MTKEILQKYINDGLSSYQIAKALNKSQTSIRYWLKKFKLRTERPNKKMGFKEMFSGTKVGVATHKKCSLCGEIKEINESNFFIKNSVYAYCRPCHSKMSVERLRSYKIKAVEYKGGKCNICGYSKYFGALDFHHLDSEKKDFNISSSNRSFNDIMKKELDKCILLCSNCHRELHGGLITI